MSLPTWMGGKEKEKVEYVSVEDYNKSMETMADLIETQRMEMPELIAEAVRKVIGEIAFATLPSLAEPTDVRHETRGRDGVWRREDTVQDMIRKNGEGYPMRVALEWPGQEAPHDPDRLY
jgi:hypothetical protein